MDEDALIGAALDRREDEELVGGEKAYVADLSSLEVAHVGFVRSEYGHATIESVDVEEARGRESVIEAFTAGDLSGRDISESISVSASPPGGRTTERPLLAADRVRFSGEIVAMVVAEDRRSARDGVASVEVEYDRREAVTDPEEAIAANAPTVHEQWRDNVAFDWEFGERDATRRRIEESAHSATLRLSNQRLIPNPMEPRGLLADYDSESGQLTVNNSTQRPHTDRSFLSDVLGISEHAIRIQTPAVGGAFGSKGRTYPEKALVTWAAIELGRSVQWIATRTEAFRSDLHSRDLHVVGEIGINAEGRITGLDVDASLGIGAYVGWGPTTAKNFRHLLSGQYAIPAISGRIVGAFTNTAPTGPYRGAGRPESIYAIERLINRAAIETGMDPVELRRRNQLPADVFPYRTSVGATYDSGNYEAAMDEALELAGYEDLRRKRNELREQGRYLGIGVSCFVESTGSSPRSNPGTARLVLDRTGKVTAYCGTADHGQGHGTTFAQVLADELGVPIEDVEVREGDTDDLVQGKGTFGSRSVPVGANALLEAARDIVSRAGAIAAFHLEADEEDVRFDHGEFFVTGSPDRSIHIQEVASLGFSDEAHPEIAGSGLVATSFYDPADYAYSFGTHLAAVEVDPESGELEFVRYVAVDDCGIQINPQIVEGQVHGGVAQGIGQALYEEGVYDETGTLVTSTFMDYAVPKAEHVPEMVVDETVTPCPHNPLGAKGAGESGTIAAPPAVINAIVNALRPFDVESIDMPATSERIWRAVNE